MCAAVTTGTHLQARGVAVQPPEPGPQVAQPDAACRLLRGGGVEARAVVGDFDVQRGILLPDPDADGAALQASRYAVFEGILNEGLEHHRRDPGVAYVRGDVPLHGEPGAEACFFYVQVSPHEIQFFADGDVRVRAVFQRRAEQVAD